MKRKGKLFLLLAVSLLVLIGWGQKKVELLSDKKLIDLSAAIGNCTLGAEDLIPDSEKDATTPVTTPVPMASVTPKPTVTPRPTSTPTSMPAPSIHPKPTLPPKPKTYEIRVRDQVVTYKNEPWTDLDILTDRFQSDCNEWTTFRLIDDYAEAHVYRKIIEILNKLETEIGLRYIIE